MVTCIQEGTDLGDTVLNQGIQCRNTLNFIKVVSKLSYCPQTYLCVTIFSNTMIQKFCCKKIHRHVVHIFLGCAVSPPFSDPVLGCPPNHFSQAPALLILPSLSFSSSWSLKKVVSKAFYTLNVTPAHAETAGLENFL